ncbi:MAG: hypothetical protein AAF570_00980 [Bacteroidota bacterium]
MSLLDPSEEDKRVEKKPRFLQDFAVVFVVLGMLLIYVLLEIFVLD